MTYHSLFYYFLLEFKVDDKVADTRVPSHGYTPLAIYFLVTFSLTKLTLDKFKVLPDAILNADFLSTIFMSVVIFGGNLFYFHVINEWRKIVIKYDKVQGEARRQLIWRCQLFIYGSAVFLWAILLVLFFI